MSNPSSSVIMISTSNQQELTWPTPTHGDALKSKGTIRFKVEKFAAFAQSQVWTRRYSAPVFIRGLPWKLSVQLQQRSRNAEKSIGCYIHCNAEQQDPTNPYWGSIVASAKLRILAQTDGKEHHDGHSFTDNSFSGGCEHYSAYEFFCMDSLEHIMDPANGWYNRRSDSIIVEAEIDAEIPQSAKHMAITTRGMKRMDVSNNPFKNLLLTGKAADVHFSVGNGDKKERLPAHKCILLASSEVFEKLFHYNEEQQGEHDPNEPLEVPDVEVEAFKLLLQFIYTRDLAGLNWDNLFDVLYAAKKHMVTELIEECGGCLNHFDLDNHNVLFMLGQARLHDEKSLIARCWTYIDRNVYAVIESTDFLKIDLKLLEELLSRDTLQMSNWVIFVDGLTGEMALWKAALRWADKQCRRKGLVRSGMNRRQMLGTALYKIRFGLIDRNDLTEEIVPADVLTKEELLSVAFCQLNPDSEAISSSLRSLNLVDQYQLKFPTGRRA